VVTALASARAELDSYGYGYLEGASNQGALLLQLITQFCANYCDAIDGTSAQVQEKAREKGELWGGARVNDIFRREFYDSVHKLDACHGLEDADIAHAIRQATGPRSPLFVPEVAFEVLARRQISLLRPFCLQAVERVMVELLRLLPACLPPQVQRFEVLSRKMRRCGELALERREKATLSMVNSLVDIELAHLNTAHPDFMGGNQAMRLIAQQLHASTDVNDGNLTAQYGQPSSVVRNVTGADLNPYAAARPPAHSDGVHDPLRPPPTGQPAAPAASGGAESSNFLQTFFSSGSKAETPSISYQQQQPPPPPPPPPPMPPMPPAPYQTPQQPSRSQLETDIIRSLLVSYFQIVRKNLQDTVPKAIMHFMVNAVRSNIQNELVAEIYRENEFSEMLQEADDAVRRRKDCQEMVVALERASKVLDELRSMRSIAY